MKNYSEIKPLLTIPATKKTVVRSFKRRFNCDFDIVVNNKTIKVVTDLPFEFCVNYSNNNDKSNVYAFLIYIANVFDFSYNLEFYSKKDLNF